MNDYYKILGISKNASREEIKKAYRKLAHQYHPDKHGGDEKKFKEINEAYGVLSDNRKRAQYDRFGHAYEQAGTADGGFGFSPEGGSASDFDFDFGGMENDALNEIFETFFEGLGIKRKRRTYEHGSDIEITQEITLEEAHKGSVKKLRYQTLVNCEKCKSLGHNPEAGFEQCAVCGGQGEIRENRSTFFGNFSRLSLCSQCNGLGQIPKSVCAECRGGGRVKGEREIALEIRPGISDGQLIKFPKAGESGEHGAENGDLYVKIRVKPHSVFERKGDDLYITKRIALTDILLEKPITLPTIAGGSIKVKVPHDYNLREPLVIAGEGMAERGNMFVILEVKTPKKLGAQAKKLLEELEKEL